MLVGSPQAEGDEELFPEVVADQAVHQEVHAGVEDGGEVGDESQDSYRFCGLEMRLTDSDLLKKVG